jgi:putative peptidoglycan lipid II flippase
VPLNHFFGPSGIAAAIALAGWSNAVSLVRRAVATFGFSLDPTARRKLPRIGAAALTMGGVLWLVASFTAPLEHRLMQAFTLFGLIGVAILAYAVLLAALGVVSRRDVVAIGRNRGPHA